MYLKEHQFEHGSRNINAAMGFTSEFADICREKIFFAHFVNGLKILELYDGDADEAPKEISTVSGDLEKALSLVDNEKEYACLLLYFIDYQQMAVRALQHYFNQKNDRYSKEEKAKLDIMKLVANLIEKEDLKDVLTLDTVADRIDIVKKSNYNFGNYMQLLGYDYNPHPDVDDILKNVFNKPDGE